MYIRRFHVLPWVMLASCGTLANIDDRYGDVDGESSADARVAAEDGPHSPGEARDVSAGDEPGSPHSDATTPPINVGDASEIDADAGQPVDAGSDVDADDVGPDVVPREASDGMPLPTNVASGHLRLWLTADQGVTCSTPGDGGVGRVTVWADQSGHQDDASLQYNQLGPQCGLGTSAHRVNGVDLPYFSAPQEPDGGLMVDETLDVNLDFLADSDYTVFAVERRWADYADGDVNSEFIVGTTEPPNIEAANPSQCGLFPNDIVFALGYAYWGQVTLVFDQGCNSIGLAVNRLPSILPVPLQEDTAVFDSLSGHTLWANGSLLLSNMDTHPVSVAAGGAIGRAYTVTAKSGRDQRFRGDIAEVVVYDVALGDSDRAAVDAYLKKHWNQW